MDDPLLAPHLGPALDRAELDTLSRELIALSSRGRKAGVRATEYPVANSPVPLTSWHFTEHMYRTVPCPFPTLARGLFTRTTEAGFEIVVRGYDKFFNVGEVPTTKPKALEADTVGPYELTVKENGCLILAAALDATHLLVTSKHALGPRGDGESSHAEVGATWVRRHLAAAGRTEAELAGFLHRRHATAVFELCDDSFEEHVLAYPEAMRGLYLHGLNRNLPTLHTWPADDVARVARHFGFWPTAVHTEATYTAARRFTDAVEQAKVYEGRPIEGFVVRCRARADGHAMLFKVKYDEPYLQYREWRELTKRLIAGRPVRPRNPLSQAYARWVPGYLAADSKRGPAFQRGQGIIAAREAFLRFRSMASDARDRPALRNRAADEPPAVPRTVLIPIATIGCGKTTLARALVHLYPTMGHVQNDDITARRNGAQAFHQAVLNALGAHPVVVADRNNHLAQHRADLTTAVSEALPHCRYVALYWTVDRQDPEQVFRTTAFRVRDRGERHQSLTPGRTPNFERILWSFLRSFRPYNPTSDADHLVTEAVELDPMLDTRPNLDRVVDYLVARLGFARPTEAALDEAVAAALVYRPTVRKEIKGSNTKSTAAAYFGLKVDESVSTVLRAALIERSWPDPAAAQACLNILDNLAARDRVPAGHHVTLLHGKELSGNPALRSVMAAYERQWSDPQQAAAPVALRADYAVWDPTRLLVLHVTLEAEAGQYPGQASRIPHITVGTTAAEVRAIQAGVTLRELIDRHGSLAACPAPGGSTEGPRVLPLTPPLRFTGYLHKYC
ncbi:trna ligase [Tieghemiomyces parasiticus]|uniref:tRNA ligase n=1 Tax=Tieghemiomyces parasiticus TaxID=78921 RepID=A0A9W8A6X1_9FUNG|nr:trna ligase [Tieghemiomyces parasiticus]